MTRERDRPEADGTVNQLGVLPTSVSGLVDLLPLPPWMRWMKRRFARGKKRMTRAEALLAKIHGEDES